MLDKHLSRRDFVKLTGAVAGSLLFYLPESAQAVSPTSLIDPYTGFIPFLFPLQANTYKPVVDNWHDNREGSSQNWSHQNGSTQRAHDGVDVFPVGSKHPTVYSPVNGIISAVLTRSSNTISSTYNYQTASGVYAPPWDYSQAVDDVASLPLYGNFIWIYSTEPASYGYYIFFCHLQYDTTYLTKLIPGATLSNTTPIGVLGDTGNAQGSPQLHTEIHYPKDSATLANISYTCSHCSPAKSIETALNPVVSLQKATQRSTSKKH